MPGRRSLLVLAVVASAGLAGSAPAASPRAVRFGRAPRLPAGAHVVGALASSAPIKLSVLLRPRDAAGLQQYATAVATPGSDAYHHYLSVAEFRQRFGPTDAQVAAVTESLRAHGLHPGAVSPNGLAIPVSSTAAAIGHAFSTSLERVSLPSGRSAFVNSQAPLLDAPVAGVVQDVAGLNNLFVPRPLALRGAHTTAPHAVRHVATGGPQPCPTASGAGAYTADQIASAYGFPGLYGAGDSGGGQTVAIFELEGNFPNDINAYRSCYGITTGSVSYSKVDGGPGAPNPANFDGLETELDVENVIGLTPAANVHVYQGPNSDSGVLDTYNAMISANSAKVISTSWGMCEQQTGASFAGAESTLFQEAATQGQSVFSASGDSGSEDCTDGLGDPLPGLAADDPGTQPFVTSAGGTRMGPIGPPPSEAVWNDSALTADCHNTLSLPVACGGGGGISQFWSMPSYQSGAPAALHVINGNSSAAPCGAGLCREVPDVAADADPAIGYAIYWDGNGLANDSAAWGAVGGTSAAAPLWAALMADVNAFSACRGTPVGFANPVLYGTAGHVYAGHFNDVTIGDNDILGTNGGRFPAGPSYDMASGLGTPNAAALASNLCAPAIAVANPGSQTSRIHTAARVQVAADDSAGYPVRFTATGLPSGLSIGATSGTISGSPTGTGVSTVTVQAVDSRGSFGNTTFRWTVQGQPNVSGGSLTGVAKGRPKLTFTLKAGTDAPKLKKVVVGLPRGLSFARSLKRGIVVNGKRVRGKLRGGKLTITLRSGVSQLRVSIGPPALRVSGSLARRVQHKQAGRLTVSLQGTDTSGFATTIKLRLKPS